MMSMSTYCLKEAAKALDWVFGGDLIISAGEVSWLSLQYEESGGHPTHLFALHEECR